MLVDSVQERNHFGKGALFKWQTIVKVRSTLAHRSSLIVQLESAHQTVNTTFGFTEIVTQCGRITKCQVLYWQGLNPTELSFELFWS